MCSVVCVWTFSCVSTGIFSCVSAAVSKYHMSHAHATFSTHTPHSPHALMTIWILEVPLAKEIGDADGKIDEIVAVVMTLSRFCCGHCTTSQGSLDWFEVDLMCNVPQDLVVVMILSQIFFSRGIRMSHGTHMSHVTYINGNVSWISFSLGIRMSHVTYISHGAHFN